MKQGFCRCLKSPQTLKNLSSNLGMNAWDCVESQKYLKYTVVYLENHKETWMKIKIYILFMSRSQQHWVRSLFPRVQSRVRASRTCWRPAAQRHQVAKNKVYSVKYLFCLFASSCNWFHFTEMVNRIDCTTWMSSPMTCTAALACTGRCRCWLPTSPTGPWVYSGWTHPRHMWTFTTAHLSIR